MLYVRGPRRKTPPGAILAPARQRVVARSGEGTDDAAESLETVRGWHRLRTDAKSPWRRPLWGRTHQGTTGHVWHASHGKILEERPRGRKSARREREQFAMTTTTTTTTCINSEPHPGRTRLRACSSRGESICPEVWTTGGGGTSKNESLVEGREASPRDSFSPMPGFAGCH